MEFISVTYLDIDGNINEAIIAKKQIKCILYNKVAKVFDLHMKDKILNLTEESFNYLQKIIFNI